MNQPEKYAVLVVTAAVKRDGKIESKPVALAVWDISVLTKSTGRGKPFDQITLSTDVCILPNLRFAL